MVYAYDQIETVHLEITSRCNASCPMCARNVLGGLDNEQLPLAELSMSDIKRIFPENFVKQLKRLYMCGNYGDPIVANDTLEVFEWLRSVNPNIRLGLHTNGSARNPAWWARLGEILSQQWDYCKFGIDGLDDTNQLYRRGTNWQRIMSSASAFIDAGGKAHWEYIVFKHNEAQVEEARSISEGMGFMQFRTKKTGRFFSNTKLEGKDRQEVLSRDGKFEYYIEKPSNPEYHNDSLSKEQALIDTFGSMQSYLDGTGIRCKVAEDRSVYVSAEGLVFPCCWTANQLYVWYQKPRQGEIWDLIDGDTSNVNAMQHGIKEIITGPYFARIRESWQRSSIGEGKLRVCAKTCGVGFDQFGSQFR